MFLLMSPSMVVLCCWLLVVRAASGIISWVVATRRGGLNRECYVS